MPRLDWFLLFCCLASGIGIPLMPLLLKNAFKTFDLLLLNVYTTDLQGNRNRFAFMTFCMIVSGQYDQIAQCEAFICICILIPRDAVKAGVFCYAAGNHLVTAEQQMYSAKSTAVQIRAFTVCLIQYGSPFFFSAMPALL